MPKSVQKVTPKKFFNEVSLISYGAFFTNYKVCEWLLSKNLQGKLTSLMGVMAWSAVYTSPVLNSLSPCLDYRKSRRDNISIINYNNTQ